MMSSPSGARIGATLQTDSSADLPLDVGRCNGAPPCGRAVIHLVTNLQECLL